MYPLQRGKSFDHIDSEGTLKRRGKVIGELTPAQRIKCKSAMQAHGNRYVQIDLAEISAFHTGEGQTIEAKLDKNKK